MSGLRANSAAENSVEDPYLKRVRSLCATHSLPCGSPDHLAAFIQALEADKHLAMEFWSLVARMSEESTELSISAMNGVVIEVVIQGITGRSVGEMIAAGRDSRRLVGELGSLLAGEDLSGPVPDPILQQVPHDDARTDLQAGRNPDIEKLRADVALLKAAFEEKFSSARLVVPVASQEHKSAVEEIAPETAQPVHESASPALSFPAMPGPPVYAPSMPEQPSADTQAARLVVTPHTVYADAQARSSGEQARMEEIPHKAASKLTLREDSEAGESELKVQGHVAWEPLAEANVSKTATPTINGTADPESKVSPPSYDGTESITAQQHNERAPGNLNRILLRCAALLLVLVGTAFAARWWSASRGMSGTTIAGSGDGPSVATTTSSPSLDPKPPSADPAVKPSASGAPSRPAASIPANSQSKPGAASDPRSEPAQSTSTASGEKPSASTLPPGLAAIVAGAEASSVNPASSPPIAQPPPASPTPEAAEAKKAPPTTQARLVSASVETPAPAPALERVTAPAPVVRVTPPPKTDTPTAVSSGVIAGSKIAGENPIYPVFARSAHISGSVVIHAIISRTGRVEDLKVVSGPQALRDSAMDAVRTWKYKPYLLDGRPADVETTVVVRFNPAN